MEEKNMSDITECRTVKKMCDATEKEVEFSGVGKTQEGWFRLSRIELYHRPVGYTDKKLQDENIFRITSAEEALDFSSAKALAQYLRDVAEDLESADSF